MTNSVVKKITITILIIVLLVACISIFAACNGDEIDVDITIKDMKGREITINPSKIHKVVCIGAGALRLYTYVGTMDKLCGVERIEGIRDDKVSIRPYQIAYEDKFKALIEEGKTAGAGGPGNQKSIPKEELAILEPDVVFSCMSLDVSVIEDAEKAIGCPIITLAYGSKKAFSSELKESLAIIGAVCCTEDKVLDIVAAMEYMEKDLDEQSKTKTSNDVFYIGCNSNWGKNGFLGTAKSPILSASHIKNVMSEEGMTISDEGKANLEQVIHSDTTKILLDAGGLEVFKNEYVGELPGTLAEMTAWKKGEIYLMMPNNAYDANVEMYYINAYYALSLAYDDITINMTDKANTILETFYGKDMVSYNQVILYGGYQQLNNNPSSWPTK